MAPQRNTTFSKSFVRRPGRRGAEDSSIPIRTEAPPPLRQPTKVARAKTLTRPERGQPQVPLLNPDANGVGRGMSKTGRGAWRIFSKTITCCCPGFCLKGCGLRDKSSQQAWREKVALVFIALLLGAFVGFITMGLNKVFCPASAANLPNELVVIGQSTTPSVGIMGIQYSILSAKLPGADEVGYDMYTRAGSLSGYDVTPLFSRDQNTYFPACNGQTGLYATSNPCAIAPGSKLKECPLGNLTTTNLQSKQITVLDRKVGYSWEDLASKNFTNLIVINGNVLNLQPYFNANPTAVPTDAVDTALRSLLTSDPVGGHDGTRLFYTHPGLKEAVPCMLQKYYAGHIDKLSPGCFVSDLILYMSLTIILGLVFVRFFMAIWFSWFMSWRLSSTPSDYGTNRVAHSRMPEGALGTVDGHGAAPWANKKQVPPGRPVRMNHDAPNVTLSSASVGNEPYVVCLITAYSEGEEGISTTLTSISETDYPDSRKLLFLVADGMVTGSGESQSTPDICVSLLDADPRFGTPMPMSFISVAQGSKQHNMAMVYAGHYTRGRGRRTPMIVVVKCGTPEEANEKKPGNRGKRDSQMILMNFFQRVTYNDRMSPLDFDLFRKVHSLMGVTPDFFELCLMVDADTKVYPKGVRTLVNAMTRDPLIMGACGETRIANKKASWVTAIQVYEYFISHHMVKAFESVFGGVTCLPGCFSMYRIKARKPNDDDWVPVIVKPEVTREYSQSTVSTLHQKNLLLLGEDRFLTTLLLRTFPNRKMVFVPQARCRTEVPHTFTMLLSQRRRWINSTVHNLMELILVRDLCGTFCFSMQFVVFMDLLGTAVLPVAICLTYTLIVSYALHPPHTFTEAIPLMLLIAVIGLPAVLILLATRKVVYTAWMLIYLIFLPVWNFVLPVYSFWHFDDFSWGETRKVEGEGKDKGHTDGGGVFAAASVPLRRWQDWELSRLKRIRREEKRRKDLEKQFGAGFYNDQTEVVNLDQSGLQRPPFYDNSDTISDTGTNEDEDLWGPHIGSFNEEAPPPLAIVRHSVWVDGQEVIVEQDDMEKMLSQGWEDNNGMKQHAIHSNLISSAMPPLRPSAANARRSFHGPPGNGGYVTQRMPGQMNQNMVPGSRGQQNPRTPNPADPFANNGPVQGRFGGGGRGNGASFGGPPFLSSPMMNSPYPSTLSMDRTPSPNGEDAILLRGQSTSDLNGDGTLNSSFSAERDPFGGDRGASSAVGSGYQTHTRNRSSGTQHFSSSNSSNDDPLRRHLRPNNNLY